MLHTKIIDIKKEKIKSQQQKLLLLPQNLVPQFFLQVLLEILMKIKKLQV